MIGRTLGRYRIVQRLGEGGVGRVFAALDTRLLRPVAVKLLLPEHADDPVLVDRLLQEGNALARVNHPNIAAVLDVGEDRDQHFLVMELVLGSTLQDLTRPRRPCRRRWRGPSAARRWPDWRRRTRPMSCTGTSSPPT